MKIYSVKFNIPLKTGFIEWYILVCFLLAGCSSNNHNLQKAEQFVDSVQKTPGPPIPPLPLFLTPKLPQVSPQLKRNPFSPTVENPLIKPDNNHPKGPLEAFPLNELHLIGMLRETNKTWGLVSTPDGRIYRIAIGQYIGQNNGKVTGITPQKLIVRETLSDGLGGWLVQTKEMPLTTQQDSAP